MLHRSGNISRRSSTLSQEVCMKRLGPSFSKARRPTRPVIIFDGKITEEWCIRVQIDLDAMKSIHKMRRFKPRRIKLKSKTFKSFKEMDDLCRKIAPPPIDISEDP